MDERSGQFDYRDETIWPLSERVDDATRAYAADRWSELEDWSRFKAAATRLADRERVTRHLEENGITDPVLVMVALGRAGLL